MGSATTRAEKRWGMRPTSPPDRPADVELHAWLDEKGGVDWTYVAWPQGPLTEMTHNQRSLVLFDAAWVVADNRAVVGAEAPAVWFALDQQGGLTWFAHGEMTNGTSWKHARWLVRFWWRITLKWAALAWRAGRGKG
jgi:hypothetical protein